MLADQFAILKAARGGEILPQGQLPSARVPKGKGRIRVRVKATGQIGSIEEKDFNAKRFERVQ
jgi:hypothetical protein